MTIKAFNKINKTEISDLEDKISMNLPADYKLFLEKYNGGKTEANELYIEELKESIIIDIFFGLTDNDDFDLLSWWEEYEGEMPEQFLMIAGDPGGNFIVLSSNPEYPGIYYWDHTHFFKSSSEERNTYFIADTFSEFLKMARVKI